MLKYYLHVLKDVFFEKPYHYILLVELEAFLFRSCPDNEVVYMRLSTALGYQEVLKNIFETG